jgi:diacylglycerol kinase family enzyme
MAERKAVRRIEFNLDAPVDVMVDGEVFTLHCEELDVLPGALNVVV